MIGRWLVGLGAWLQRRKGRKMVNQWFVVVDDTAPDEDDPALLVHVVDLAKEEVWSVARRQVRWQVNENTLDYFARSGNDPGLRAVSRAHAGDVARLWGAQWPPPHE